MTAVPDHWNRTVARRLRKGGLERTPAEVSASRMETLAAVRQSFAKRGILLPEGELEAVNFLRALAGRGPVPNSRESGPGPAGREPMS